MWWLAGFFAVAVAVVYSTLLVALVALAAVGRIARTAAVWCAAVGRRVAAWPDRRLDRQCREALQELARQFPNHADPRAVTRSRSRKDLT
jgi:hypothetical protein